MNTNQIKTAKRIWNTYISKKALDLKTYHRSLSDLVSEGYDVNAVEEDVLVVVSAQECVIDIKDMMTHSDFSKEAWLDRLSDRLKKAGLAENKISTISEKAVNNFFTYLKSLGWF